MADSALARALALVRDLRTRCPWDHSQTRATLRPYLVEEALELDQALRSDDPVALRNELGDLLLHLAFQVVIGDELGQFDAESVTRALEEKMWRRHPQLFGATPPDPLSAGSPSPATSPDHQRWELVKRKERGAGSTLRGLPPSLPPLLMAFRLQERAAGIGFDWPDARGPLEKVKEEVAEVEQATGNVERRTLEEEIGDLLFAGVNLARKHAIDPRAALERANDKFRRRFEGMERLAETRGVDIGRTNLQALDELWEEVKAVEGGRKR